MSPDVSSGWRLLLQLAGERRGLLLASIVAGLVRSLLLMAATLAVGKLVQADGHAWIFALLAVACTAASGLLSNWARAAAVDAVKTGIARLRETLVARALAMPSSAVAEFGGARLRHILAQDSERLDHMSNAVLGVILPALVTAAALLFFLLFVAPIVGGIAAMLLALLLARSHRSARGMRGLVQEANAAVAQLDQGMALMLRRHDLAKASAGEAFEMAERRGDIGRARTRTARIAKTMTRLSEAEAATTGIAIVLLIFALTLSPRELLSLETMAPALFLLTALRGTVQSLASAARDAAGGMPALARVQAVLAWQSRPKQDLPAPPGWTVEARGVCFSHGPARLLRDVNLRIGRGEVVVLTGANGSGKTTLLQLLLGLATPQSGTVLADGVSLAQLDGTAWRRSIGYVPQSPVLFPGTIAANIAYDRPDLSAVAIARAAELAGATAFATALAEGLETMLGDEGAPLSGGQRQRVALARALARCPKLLILDEPSNQLDDAGVRHLVALLRALPDAPGILLVSHDASLLSVADSQYALDSETLVRRDANRLSRSAA